MSSSQGCRRQRAFVLFLMLAVFVGNVRADDVTYDYDPTTGRLTRATYASGIVVNYEYDNKGNRTTVTTSGASRGVLSLVATSSYSGGEASAQRTVTVQVQRTGGSHGEARVSYATVDGTATAASGDYAASSGTLRWAHGDSSSKSFNVTILDDTQLEPNESFGVTLSVAAGAALGSPASASVVIVDDEADTIPPGAPGPVTFSSITANSAVATWTAANDNRDVTAYRYRLNAGGWQQLGKVLTTPVNALADGTSYSFELQAGDAAGNWSASVTGTFRTLDTQRPTDVAALSATISRAAQVDLTWSAASDNAGVIAYELQRCLGAGCTSFAQIATPAANAHLDVGVVSSTTYRYRVRARDAAGNVSQNWSPIATATTQADTQAPGAPTNVTARVPSGTQVDLSWTASTDEGGSGLAGYKIERCTGANCTDYSQVGTTAATNYSDTGRTASTTYKYRVRAYDGAGNHSAYGGDISVTTPVDATPPTNPAGLAANVVSSTRIDLNWTAATDSGGSHLAGYRIERCQGASCSNFAQIATSATNSYSSTGLSALTTYQYRVRAYDGAGNNSATYSNTANATTLADTIPPGTPSIFQAAASSSTQITLSLGAAMDEGGAGVAGYEIERCQGNGCTNFAALRTTPAPGEYADSNLPPSTTFVYRARAFDAATPANRSAWLTATATTAADTQPPTTPATMTVTTVSSTQLNISWAASTEQGGSSLAGYELDRCEGAGCTSFARVTTTAPGVTSYSNTNLRPNTVHVYRVRAYDTANPANYTGFVTANGTTLADTQGPTVPTNLAGAVASSSQINLSWTASADQGGSAVAGYEVWRCLGAGCSNFARIGTSASNSFQDKGLTDARTYVYRVRAYDTVVPANFSGDSTSLSIAVPDMTAPTAPDVRLVSVTASTARLSWGDPSVTDAQKRGAPATDNVGVARYEYQIGSGSWVDVGGQLSAALNGLAVNVTYSINVRARDAAGNAGQAAATQVVTIDDVPPGAPSGLRAENVTTYSARVRWNAASDNVAVTGYRYTLNSLPPQEIGVTDYVDFGGMAQGQTYTFRIEARDQRNNWGPAAAFTFTTLSLSGSLNDASLSCIASIGQTTYQYRTYRLSANGPSHDGGCYNYTDPGNLGAWKVPASQVATYQVRATSDCPSSNFFGSPLGVWTTLGSSQLWWQVFAEGFEGYASCGVRIEVRDPTDPSAILDDANISFFIFQGQ